MNPADITILVVDDDPDVLHGTTQVLEKEGYRVAQAASGEEALKTFEACRPELLLLDRDLPDLDGLEVCRRIKSDPTAVDSLVVLASGSYVATENQAEGLEAGADGYIVRPVANRELRARVAAYVRLIKLRRELRRKTDELERRHAEATAAQLASLNLAEDAVAARERAESANRELLSEIAERKRLQAAFVASELRYRRLFESAKDGLLILDAETGMVVDCNPFMVDLLGFSRAVFLGKKVWELGFLKDIVGNEANFAELQRCEYIHYEGKALETSEGRRIEVEFISNVYLVAGQKVIQCNIRDISERVKAEKRLRQLSRIVEQAPFSIIITDLAGRIEYANPRFCTVSGYTEQEATGQNPRILKSGETAPEIYRAMWQTITHGKVWTGELRNRRKNGEIYLESVVIAPVVDDKGQTTHYVALKDDVTAQKRSAADAAAKLEREHQISEMKSRFISVTSHEFRTPMAAAMGSVELLLNHLDRLTPAKRQELLNRIDLSLHRMTAMLDDILTLNRLDTNRTEVRLGPLDLRLLLRNVMEEIELGDRKAHVFELRTAGDCGAFVSDPNLLHHIFSNLFSNAVRYSAAGKLVQVAATVDATGARVAITDQGIGIPPADLTRLFQPFERGSNVGTIGGTGLGLNIVKRMTEGLGGTITVAPVASGGTCFTLTLPPPPISPGPP